MINTARKLSTVSNDRPKEGLSINQNSSIGVGKKKREVEVAKAKPRGGMYIKNETVLVKEGLSRAGEKWSPAKEGWEHVSKKVKEEEKSEKRPQKVVGRRTKESGEASSDAKGNEGKKSEKELGGKAAKSVFKMRDMSCEIGKEVAKLEKTLTDKDRARASIISLDRASAQLRPSADKLRLVLTAMDLADPATGKMNFAWRGDYNTIKIKLETVKDVVIFIDFIKNPDNEKLLSRIEVIEVGDINSENVAWYQELLDALDEKKDQLKNLSTWVFGEICSHFENPIKLIFPKVFNLGNIVCGSIIGEVTFRFPERLRSLSCGNIINGFFKSLEELKELTTLSCRNIYAYFTIPKEFINMTSFSFGDLGNRANDCCVIVPKELKKLQSFKCGDFYSLCYIQFPEELKTLSSLECGRLVHGNWSQKGRLPIIFPKNLDNLSVFRFGLCADLSVKKEFEKIQVDIAVRESKKKAENKES